jgi:hypothetical protein
LVGIAKVIVNVAARGLPDELCEIEWVSEAGAIAMTARAASIGMVSIKANDVFGALVNLRLQLESRGRLLLCNAARKDAYPSRMLLEMGGGRKSYVLHQGKQATKMDLIDVFEPATYEQVGTVAEQRRGYEEWLRSLM